MRLPEPLDRILQRAWTAKARPGKTAFTSSSSPRNRWRPAACPWLTSFAGGDPGTGPVLLGQIGIETSPCPGKCGFCVFGEGHASFETVRMPVPEVLAQRTRAFAGRGDLYALFLMTMHSFDFDNLLAVICEVRRCIPPQAQIDREHRRLHFGAGPPAVLGGRARGAYHVCRLREGTDTALSPPAPRDVPRDPRRGPGFLLLLRADRAGRTRRGELVEQMFLGLEYGCFQHAGNEAGVRPGIPLSVHGQITELRLGQATAVVSLAMLSCRETQSIAVHEPNLIGLTSGANAVYAETGANPRDTEADTSANRGLDMAAARRKWFTRPASRRFRARRQLDGRPGSGLP